MAAIKTMRKFIKYLSYAGAVVIVLIALASLVARWLLLDINSHRDEVALLLERVSPMEKVEFGALHADLSGWDLTLQAKDLKWVVSDADGADEQSTAVGSAQFRVNLLDVLLAQRPVIRSAHFSDAHFRVMTDDKRNIHFPQFGLRLPADALLGALGSSAARDASRVPSASPARDASRASPASVATDTAAAPRASDASPARDTTAAPRTPPAPDTTAAPRASRARTPHPSIYAERVTIDWYQHNTSTPLRFNNVSWMFNPHNNGQPRAVLRADLPPKLGEQIHIELGTQGDGYMQLTAVNIANTLQAAGVAAPAQGRISANVHAQFSAGTRIPEQLSGNVVLNDFAFNDTFRASTASSEFVWQSDDASSRLGLFNLSLASPDMTLRSGKIGIAQARLTDTLARSAIDIDLDTMNGISPSLIRQATAELMQQLNPDVSVDIKTIKTLQVDATLNHPAAWLIADGDWQALKEFSPARLPPLIAATPSTVNARAEIVGATVQYSDTHPPLQKIDGVITLDDKHFVADLSRIHTRGFVSQDMQIAVQDITAPYATVKGTAKGSLQNVFALLQSTPMAAKDAMLKNIKAKGNTTMHIDFGVPLADSSNRAKRFIVALDLDRTSLRVNPQLPMIENMQGRITFDAAGVHAKAIDATVYDHLVVISARPQGTRTAFTVVAKDMPAATLAKFTPIPASLMKGSADGQADVIVPLFASQSAKPPLMRVSSDLKGLALDIPQPFGKRAADARPFVFEKPLKPNAYTKITYQDAVQFDFLRTPSGLVGVLYFAPDSQYRFTPSPDKTLKLRGNLREVSLAKWYQWWNAHRVAFGDKPPANRRVVIIPPVMDDMQLTIERFVAGGTTFHDVQLTTERTRKKRFVVKLDAPTLKGKVIFPPPHKDRVYINMEQLQLSDKGKATPAAKSVIHPQNIPPFSAKIKALKLRGMRLDDVRLMANPTDGGIDISSLSFKHYYKGKPIMRTTMTGSWTKQKQDRSQLAFLSKSNDYGRLFRRWGFSTGLRETHGKVQGQLAWDAPVYMFDIAKAQGDVRLSLKNGRMRTVEPGVGKLLGVLNLSAIVSRFKLDFSNVFRKGLTFKRFKGTLQFKGGNMYTDDLIVKGGELGLALQGRTGIVARDYEQELDVVPNFSSSIPLATALLGGPIAGAVALFIDKTTDAGEQLNEAITLRYTVTGSWDDPQINFVKAPQVDRFNPGEKLKELFQGIGKGIEKIVPN